MEFRQGIRMGYLKKLFPEIAERSDSVMASMFMACYAKAVRCRRKSEESISKRSAEIGEDVHETLRNVLGVERCAELGLCVLLQGGNFPLIVDKSKVPADIAEVLGYNETHVYLWIG